MIKSRGHWRRLKLFLSLKNRMNVFPVTYKRSNLPFYKQTGFTLIELLVSMAVFSIMAGGMYLVFNNFTKVKAITDRDSVRLAEMQRAFTFIKRDISYIVPRPVKDEYGSAAPLNSLSSDGDAIEFTRSGWNSPPFLARKRSELQRVSYRLEDGKLKRNYWYVLDRAQDSMSKGLDLLTGVEELSFKFYYPDPTEIKDISQWPPATALPYQNLGGCGIINPNEIYLPELVEIIIKTADYGVVTRKFSVLSGYAEALSLSGGC